MRPARLIYANPKQNSDLLYAAHFQAPDPVLFLEHQGKKTLFLSPLEIGRGKREASVDKVLPLPSGSKNIAEVIFVLLKERRIRSIEVPPNTSFALVEALKKKVKVTAGPFPFYPKRLIKTPKEVQALLKAQKVTFGAMRLAENILRQTRIKKGLLYWKGKILTSKILRFQISVFLLEQDYNPLEPIGLTARSSSIFFPARARPSFTAMPPALSVAGRRRQN